MQRIGNTLEYSIKISGIICNYSLNKLKVNCCFTTKISLHEPNRNDQPFTKLFFFSKQAESKLLFDENRVIASQLKFFVVEKNRIF